jgi:hypothetical protein
MRNKPANDGKRWTAAEDRQLRKETAGNTPHASSPCILSGRRMPSATELASGASHSSRPTRAHMAQDARTRTCLHGATLLEGEWQRSS